MARDPFIAVDKVGDTQVFPMIFSDSEKVADLFAKFNPDLVGVSLLNEGTRAALLEILKLATKLPGEDIGKLNVIQMQEIVDIYIGVSRLKKKMEV